MKKILLTALILSIFMCSAPPAPAGTITGQIQTPSTGRGVPNGILTFTLSQVAVVSGTATLAANGNCWTDTNGSVVGLPGDAAIAAPVLSSNLGSGSLAAGTYFVRYTWANATGEAQPSAERSLTLTSSGTLVVQAPGSVPATATSMKVYIGAAAGAETLQGSVAVNNGVIGGNFNQAIGLAAGAVLPSSNTSVCQIRFNDELQPSFTGYIVSLTNVSGASMAGFPQKWYLSGGSNGTVNVGVGLPLYSGVVVYPQPIVSNPAANSMQSINGPLNMNGFAILNTVITNPNGAVVLPEIAPPGGVAGSDVLYADSTAHRFKMINNNGAADVVVGANTADVLTNKTLDTAGGNAIKINGNSLSAAAGTATVTVPNATDTLVARATTDTLTNKTFGDTALLNGSALITAAPPTAGSNTGWKLSMWGSGYAIGVASGTIALTANPYVSLFSNSSPPANDSSGSTPDSHAKVTLGADGTLTLAGSTSGSTVVKSGAAASGTLTLPAATDTLVARATTDTLSNKTFDTASGNTFKINGTQISSVTGTGSVAVLSTSPVLTTPNIGASTGNTHTFVNQTAPANPPVGSITIYGDSGSGNLACRNSSGTSCLSASATAPLISTSANPAGSGVVRVASTDTAVAFRNNANNGDLGVTKNTSDVMDLSAFNGVKLQTLQITAPNGTAVGASCSGGAFIYNDAASPNSMNLCFGDGTGWKLNFSKRSSSVSTSVANLSDSGVFTTSVFQTASSNPAGSGVFRCANNQQCLFGRNAANNADVEIASVLNDNSVRLDDAINTPSNVVQVPHVKYTGGVTNSGAGMMHVRATTCTTSSATNPASCNTTITWPGTWADTNYTAVCTADQTGSAAPLFVIATFNKTTTQMSISIQDSSGITATSGTVQCIGMHD